MAEEANKELLDAAKKKLQGLVKEISDQHVRIEGVEFLDFEAKIQSIITLLIKKGIVADNSEVMLEYMDYMIATHEGFLAKIKAEKNQKKLIIPGQSNMKIKN